ncbi:GAP family protein [Aquihabitans sp. McL0605]|uniref:GAP family protein n=1 Tax=Aquihabitans sp. McL0605 TaxID=3415671 RepID=UPI003CF1F823
MLIQAIGQLLPAAVAVALSPIPIIAIVLMLGTPKARTNGPAFAVGWVAGLVVVMAVVLVVAGGSDTSSTASDTVNWFQVAVGVLFLVMAAKQWRGRPKKGEVAEMPSWMATVDKIEPGKALLLGAALSAANPKNLALTASAAAAIAQAGLSDGDTVLAALAFVIIGSITVAGSVVFYLVDTDKASVALASVKDFMTEHNAVIMMVILLLLGVKILGQGLGGVAS